MVPIFQFSSKSSSLVNTIFVNSILNLKNEKKKKIAWKLVKIDFPQCFVISIFGQNLDFGQENQIIWWCIFRC